MAILDMQPHQHFYTVGFNQRQCMFMAHLEHASCACVEKPNKAILRDFHSRMVNITQT